VPLPRFRPLVEGTGYRTADQSETSNGDSHPAIMAGYEGQLRPTAPLIRTARSRRPMPHTIGAAFSHARGRGRAPGWAGATHEWISALSRSSARMLSGGRPKVSAQVPDVTVVKRATRR
jgi:hypothetical protein